ncbi:MAG: phenylalanine--tRNA ligase subunit beta [Candidatus Marinimicrobia bacterium]|nr:phenylalanine--tRNA ligase subunit beta [Candidatus Neomarinimicrobiota bacterium]
MKFSYEWLQSYFDEELPEPKKLADLLSLHSFEVEDVKKIENDTILDLDILPNRVADCSSHLGIAREISAILNYELRIKNYELGNDSELKTKDFVEIKVQDEKLCPRYMATLIKGVSIGESPDWIKNRLLSIGVNSINNIVDIANYVMLEMGQPLHAFDLTKLEGGKIIIRNAKKGEEIETLDNKHIILNEDNLIIADEKHPLAIAGIKGGKKAEITEATKDIVIEAAIFDGVSIRKTSKDVNIRTDASFRFEHNLSLALPEKAIKRTAEMIKEIAGGEIAGSLIDTRKEKFETEKVIFKEDDVANLLGKKIPTKDIEGVLKRLGFSLEKDGENYFVTPPIERTDIKIKEDVVEEVIRIYGYENIESVTPIEVLPNQDENEEYFFSNFIRGVLVDMGFTEVYNYSFSKIGKVELENPISKHKKFLRNNLKDDLALNMVENFKNFEEVKFFEIGKVFNTIQGGVIERTRLSIAVGNKKNTEIAEQELKGAVEVFLNKLGVADVGEFDKCITGNIFEVDIIEIIDIAKENIEIPDIVNFDTKDVEYKKFSKFPAVVRDISLFVPADIRIEDVAGIIAESGGEMLVDTDLFDEYSPPDSYNKSLAFHLIFQSFEKTLTDEEVNTIRDKIISALEENEAWEVRK